MKTKIKVNAVAQEITMTKATAKEAAFVGTEAYTELLQATKDFPNFKVKVLTTKTKENRDKGLTIELMEKLIKGMTNHNQAAIAGFEEVKETFRGTNFHFSRLKAYFLAKYPDWREWLPEAEQGEKEVERKRFFA